MAVLGRTLSISLIVTIFCAVFRIAGSIRHFWRIEEMERDSDCINAYSHSLTNSVIRSFAYGLRFLVKRSNQ